MMISVCIPVFQVEVEKLVSELNNQIQNQSLDVEIILIDDASDESIREKNSNLKVDKYIQLDQNIGRSKIRNLFLKYGKGDYLLFLDCDVLVQPNFIQNYFDFLFEKPESKVVYGGFTLQDSSEKSLRNMYSVNNEIQTVQQRQTEEYRFFKTVNFLISKDIFSKIIFDESIKSYGYEDFVFAIELKKKDVKVDHIHNPVLHADNDSNEIFITKTETAIQTLIQLLKSRNYAKELEQVTLVKFSNFVKKMGVKGLFLFYFNRNRDKIKRRLIANQSPLYFLSIYKLGYFLENNK